MGKQHRNICPICGDNQITFKREYTDYSSNPNSYKKSLLSSIFPFFIRKKENKYSYIVGCCNTCGHTWKTFEDSASLFETLMWIILIIFFIGFILIWKFLQWYFNTDKIFMTTRGRLYLLCALLLSAVAIFGIVGFLTKPI